jgi:alkanesulfonate monooxygenase SsuD/methylene tetrahydromethanopterin reductase-like flavin-dependent oxidoreductase (luciferase family)
MKIGLQVPRFHWPGSPENIGPKLAEIAKAADDYGFSSLWVMDHFYQVGQGYGEPEEPMLEAYTASAYMAAVTSRVKLGTMVTGAFYRYPGILVKTVNMWSDDRFTFEGKYYRLKEPICSPQPVSRPHPYIMIGGEGERKTLRFVAKYADGCNLHLGAHPKLKGYTPRAYDNYRNRSKRLRHKLEVLRRHCEREGRDYDEIDKSVLSPVEVSPEAMTTGEVVVMCRELSEMGFNYVVFNMPNDHEITPLEVIGEEVIPLVENM